MDAVADLRHDFLLDRVGLAADPRPEVPTPTVVEGGHLGEPRGLAVGDAVTDLGLQAVGEFLEHPPIIRQPRLAIQRKPLAGPRCPGASS
jgi:hypothetical protein